MTSTIKLSKGYEFILCNHEIMGDTFEATILFDGTYTAEQLLNIWANNTSFILTLVDEFENTNIEKYDMYTVCSAVSLMPHSSYREIQTVCTACDASVDETVATCPNCEADLTEENATKLAVHYVEDQLLCRIVCRKVTPIERISDIENALEALINMALN